jgi:regulator of RNase E activity RraB
MTEINETTRKVIDQMIAYGMQEGHPYVIEFAFFGDSTKLSQLRDHLTAKGFKQDTSQTDKMLVLTNSVQLDYENIGQSITEMKNIANEFGVKFDGWSANPNQ